MDHIPLSFFDTFTNCFWHLVCLPKPPTNATFAVTDDDKGTKTEPSTTLNYFCYAVNLDYFVNKILFN
ncbi:uncharacterized protein METZ01_LOCUS320468, partial [marine metagenome]